MFMALGWLPARREDRYALGLRLEAKENQGFLPRNELIRPLSFRSIRSQCLLTS